MVTLECDSNSEYNYTQRTNLQEETDSNVYIYKYKQKT